MIFAFSYQTTINASQKLNNILMKKLYSFIFIVLSLFAFSQNYKFDYAIVSNINNLKYNSEKTENTNLYDSTKKQHLYIRMIDGDLKALIVDEKNGFNHHFKANQGKDFLTFQYLNSEKINNHKNVILNDIIEISKIDSLQYQVIGYKNEKKKSKRFTALITLQKSDLDYLVFGIDHAKNEYIEEEFRKILDPETTFKIAKINLKYSTGVQYEISYNFKKIDLDFKIPSQLIIADN